MRIGWRGMAAGLLMGVVVAALPTIAVAEDVRLDAAVDPAVAGSAAAPEPVAARLSLSVGAAGGGAGPPRETRELAVDFPPGFTFTGDRAPACDAEDLGVRGPAACPPGSQLGSGQARFVYLPSSLRIRGATDALALYAAGPGRVLLYLHVSRPAELAYVFPGVVGPGPSLTFDLREVADAPTGTTSLTAVTLELPRGGLGTAAVVPRAKRYKVCRAIKGTRRSVCHTCRGRGTARRCWARRIEPRPAPRPRGAGAALRGGTAPRAGATPTAGALAAGPCGPGGWTFAARLLLRGGERAQATATVPCTAPAGAAATPSTPPLLSVPSPVAGAR